MNGPFFDLSRENNMHKYSVLYLFIFLLFPFFLNGQSELYSIEKTRFSKNNYHEFSPVYFWDGLVFTTNLQRGLFNYSSGESGGLMNIYIADTIGTLGKKKARFFSKYLNTRVNDGPITFSSNRDTVYFTRNRLVEGKVDELSSPWNKLGIYSAELVLGKWTNIREFRYNSEWYNLTTPCLSPDSKRLYFASDMPDGYGGSDLYYCEWKNGYWDTPVNMGPVINSEGNETYPFVNSSGEFFFSSDGHGGMGGKDIFYTIYSGNKWLEPVPLDPPINSPSEDFGFICDTLFNSGYFSSDRDKSIDVYYFKTNFPQVFFPNYQREDNYCYTLMDSGFIKIDTTRLELNWNIGELTPPKGSKINHCFPGPGDYNLRLEVIDKKTGKLFFKKAEFNIGIDEIKLANINAPDILVKGTEFEFSADPSNFMGYTILDYAWDFGDSTRVFGDTVIHSYADPGEYDINLFLVLQSEVTGKKSRTSVTKKIRIVNNQIEKEYFSSEAETRDINYKLLVDSPNTRISKVFSARDKLSDESAFTIQLLSSQEQLRRSNQAFRTLPDKYILKERFDPQQQLYTYTVELQNSLMALYPSFNEIQNLGFRTAEAKLIRLTNPAEIELFALHKRFDPSTDSYFDSNNRLTTDAYIMMDQIVNFMVKYPNANLEVSVHTDNTGSASSNLAKSRQQARVLTDYLITRGVSRNRITDWGYGETKPVASNIGEENRKKNRRIEFTLL